MGIVFASYFDMHTQETISSLHQKTIAAAAAEKAATFYLLECLFELDRRRGYLELGYSSLFDYVQTALGYSSSQAYERVSAMRLAFKVSTVGEKLKSGELTLTAVAKIASHAKREKLPSKKIADLAVQAVGKPIREVERVLAQNAVQPIPPRESIKAVNENTFALHVTIDQEFETLLKEAKELEADPTLSMAQVLKRALQSHVAQKQKQKTGEVARANRIQYGKGKIPVTGKSGENRAALPGLKSFRKPNSRYIPRASRQIVWQRAHQQCQYISATTNLRCQTRQSLEIDHRLAVARGGSNATENLQLLCRAHNLWKGTS